MLFTVVGAFETVFQLAVQLEVHEVMMVGGGRTKINGICIQKAWQKPSQSTASFVAEKLDVAVCLTSVH